MNGPGQTFDFASNPAQAAGTCLATQAEGKLKGIKRVAITDFCVQFVYGKQAQATSSGYWAVYSQTASGSIQRAQLRRWPVLRRHEDDPGDPPPVPGYSAR